MARTFVTLENFCNVKPSWVTLCVQTNKSVSFVWNEHIGFALASRKPAHAAPSLVCCARFDMMVRSAVATSRTGFLETLAVKETLVKFFHECFQVQCPDIHGSSTAEESVAVSYNTQYHSLLVVARYRTRTGNSHLWKRRSSQWALIPLEGSNL